MIRCWCGNADLAKFSTEYLKCPACETLITVNETALAGSRVVNDGQDFYGREYWFSHQIQDLGFVDVTVRARTDLPERSLHWLHAVLKYKLPPGRVLELGSAHGGFVAMLRWAGFEATGLELSPWVANYARQIFNIPILLGPIEDQGLALGSLDIIALMDVLEHLADPVGTMRHCLRLLKPDGILIIQTPRYPEGKTYDAMATEGDPFLELLRADEHLYLFSPSSVREMFHHLGADHLAFEPAIFAHYDMFLAVSRMPLATHSADETEKALSATPGGRLIRALFDVDAQRREVAQKLDESEADRAARLENIHNLEKLLVESEADRTAQSQAIEAQERRLHELETRHNDLRQQTEHLRTDLGLALSALGALQASRIYQWIRRLGRWGWLEQMISQAVPQSEAERVPEVTPARQRLSATGDHPALRRVAIDLTPVLPGGENGGAKLVATELVRQLAQITPDCEWILLTSEKSHAELAELDAPNVRRQCVTRAASVDNIRATRLLRLKAGLREMLARILPPAILARLKTVYRAVAHRSPQSHLPRRLDADLLFCPFTAPFFFDPTVPAVSVVHDLQYLYYPQLFSADDRYYRDKHFKEACGLAARLICVSEHVRETVLANAPVAPERVITVHTRLFDRLKPAPPEIATQVLDRLGLQVERFLLYPANFWPHKNHGMLLTAWGMYQARRPEPGLKLVCTGAPGLQLQALIEAVTRMGLEGTIIFPGYVPDEEFAGLLQSCQAIIFPSLYEGFGLPVLEAMAFGKPVTCSNVTSLPQVAGDAALYFDPRKPNEIAGAIERITSDAGLVADLIERGHRRLAALGDAQQMAREYLRVFQDAVEGPQWASALHGVYADGWTGGRLTITFGAAAGPRHLELVLAAPPWLPHDQVSITGLAGETPCSVQIIKRGKSALLHLAVPEQSGHFELLVGPTFQPKAHRMNDDERWLGCLCHACNLVSPTGQENLLQGAMT